MPQFVVRLDEDCYLLWSTIVDAPVSPGLRLEDFQRYYQTRFGTEGMRLLPARLERVAKTGTSAIDGTTTDGLILGNRAGDGETELTREELIAAYKEERWP